VGAIGTCSLLFFFSSRRRHTILVSDWSSDVCSSDLGRDEDTVTGLDDGYNPQGLAVASDSVLVAAYRSESPEVHRGPCRVFRVDTATGRATGQLDVPPPCGHAGGLAIAAAIKRFYVADTHTLLMAALGGAFDDGGHFATHPLGPGLVGALAVSGTDAIWLGTYREDEPGWLYRFTAAALDAMPDGAALNASDATFQIAVPSHAQGAARGVGRGVGADVCGWPAAPGGGESSTASTRPAGKSSASIMRRLASKASRSMPRDGSGPCRRRARAITPRGGAASCCPFIR